jgi:hypothetical protein
MLQCHAGSSITDLLCEDPTCVYQQNVNVTTSEAPFLVSKFQIRIENWFIFQCLKLYPLRGLFYNREIQLDRAA